MKLAADTTAAPAVATRTKNDEERIMIVDFR